jgi:hypothetical protein
MHGWDESMAEEDELDNVIMEDTEMSSHFAMDFLILKKAIVDNCRDCIRDCGRDCLDNNVKPIENIRCPLQKVRIDYEISIKEDTQENPVISSSKYHGFELK